MKTHCQTSWLNRQSLFVTIHLPGHCRGRPKNHGQDRSRAQGDGDCCQLHGCTHGLTSISFSRSINSRHVTPNEEQCAVAVAIQLGRAASNSVCVWLAVAAMTLRTNSKRIRFGT